MLWVADEREGGEHGDARAPDSEPIPGYKLVHPLGRGGFGEVWKCVAVGGLLKAIKFIPARRYFFEENNPAAEELRAIERIKSIRHPYILSLERVEQVADCLVVVSELADMSLADALKAERDQGRRGIPRDRLMGYLAEAAEALDVMNFQHGLQHLDVKPQNLFLVSNHIKVGDFGLVRSIRSGEDRPAGETPSNLSPLYAAPEVLGGSVSPHSDQYSLAIAYQELLTGTLPFPGKNCRQLMIQHLTHEPDVSALPPADQAVVRRALAKSPSQRFPSCADFIHALNWRQTELVSRAVRRVPEALLRAAESAPKAEAGTLLYFRFGSVLPPESIRARLEGFRSEWGGKTASSDALGLVMHVPAPQSAWRSRQGRGPTLHVALSFVSVHGQDSTGLGEGSEVRMEVSPLDPTAEHAPDLFSVVGPLLAESVRMHTQATPSRRTQVRLGWRHPLRMASILPDGGVGPEVTCQGKDISLNGIGFYVEKLAPDLRDVMLHLPATAFTVETSIKARVVRVKPCGDGWYEVGAILNPPTGDGQPAAQAEEAPPGWPTTSPARRGVTGLLAVITIGLMAFSLGANKRPHGPHELPPRPGLAAPFVASVGGGSFDLAAAVKAVPDGGVIEVRGTVRCRFVRLWGKAVTIRGVPGSRAVIERVPDAEAVWEPLLSSDRDLTLEGVELRGTSQDLAPLASVEGANLALRGCELTMLGSGPAATVRLGSRLLMERSVVKAAGQALGVEMKDRPCRVDVRDCRVDVRDNSGLFLFAWSDARGPAAPLDVALTGSNVRAGRGLAVRGLAGPVSVEARGGRLFFRQQRVIWLGYANPSEQPAVAWSEHAVTPAGADEDVSATRHN